MQIEFGHEIPFEIKKVICRKDSNWLRVTLTLNNPTLNTVGIALTDWEIETQEGIRSPAINTSDSVIQIGSNKISKIELLFDPINSLKLFRQTGIKGSLLQSYKLNYRETKGHIYLAASKKTYEAYLKNQERPKIFFIDTMNLFKKQELNYLQANLGLNKNGVEIHDEEFLINGLNLILNIYAYKDTVYLKMKVVNHSVFPINIKPGAITLRTESNIYNSVAQHKTDSATIPRSQRGYLEERYPVKNFRDRYFFIDISSISFLTPKPISVFYCKDLRANQFGD
ncbi:MAG: hypothetical protein JST48_00220 [Bacteroidetes bacterium]|nr:hypothetical protein [Bacteroidota bacterium]